MGIYEDWVCGPDHGIEAERDRRGLTSTGVENQIWDAIRVLILSFLIVFIHKQGKEAGEKNGRLIAMRNGIGICLGIAFFAAITLGHPSCADEDDGAGGGGCSQYNDDGYTPTHDAQLGTFLFWLILLNTPLIFGIMDSRQYQRHPWKRPVVIKPPEDAGSAGD